MKADEDANQHSQQEQHATPDTPNGDVVPASTSQQSAEQNQTDAKREMPTWNWRDNLTLIFEGILTVASVIGVVFLILQWRQTNQALFDNRYNAIAAQRPFVMVDPQPSIRLVVGEKIGWDVDARNDGQSHAIKQQMTGHVYFGPNALAMADEFFRRMPERLNGPGTAIIPPDRDMPDTTVLSYDRPTDADITAIKTHDFWLVVTGRIEYEDLFGQPYRTDFCYGLMAQGGVAFCDRHNQMK